MMGTGINPEDAFPIMAGRELRWITALQLPRPWVPGILGQLENHSFTAALGHWFGEPRLQWVWFHNGYEYPAGVWNYVVASEFSGDPHTWLEAEFMAGWLGTLVYSQQTGEFTPY